MRPTQQTPSILLLCLCLSAPGSLLAQLDTRESEIEGAGGGASDGSHSRHPVLGEHVADTNFQLASIHSEIGSTGRIYKLDCNQRDSYSLWAWVKDGRVVGTEPSLTFRFNESNPFSVYYCVLQPDDGTGKTWVRQFVVTDDTQAVERPLIGRFNGSHLVVNITSPEKLRPPVTNVTCTNTAIVNSGVQTNQSHKMHLAFRVNRLWSLATGPINVTRDGGQIMFPVRCKVERAYGLEQRLLHEFTEIISGDYFYVGNGATSFRLVPIIIGTIVSLLLLLLLVLLIRYAMARRSQTQN